MVINLESKLNKLYFGAIGWVIANSPI